MKGYSLYNLFMSRTLSLYRLQQTDSRMDRANTRIAEIQKIIENDEALQLVIAGAEKTKESFKEALHNLNNAESVVQDQRLKIEQSEASLYSGVVKNPKELQDLQNEIAALKRHLAVLEDRLLDAMVACEDAEATHQICSQQLEIERQRTADHNSDLAQELNELTKEKEKLKAEHLAIAGSIAEDMIDLYENLRIQKRGVAVSLVADNTCGICGTTLTPAQAQAVRLSSQIYYCPTCGRILYGN